MNKDYYYDEKNPKCKDMKLNESGYPVYKDNPTKLVHRYYVWKYLLNKSRELKEWEKVHHVDGDKLNFNPSNLVILSDETHKKISGRLNKETNLNKANSLVISIIFVLFAADKYYNRSWNTLNRIIALLLIIGILISQYQNIVDLIMRKTKLYKVIDVDN
ncbi:MAG: HNH endonuclease [Nanoarchaeota archaeon]